MAEPRTQGKAKTRRLGASKSAPTAKLASSKRAGKKSGKSAASGDSLAKRSFLGLPGSWKFPGFQAIGSNLWNTSKTAQAFPPKVWGYGWSFNFGYALSKNKPTGKRFLAFLFGVVAILAVLYAIAVFALVSWYVIELYLLTPKAAEPIVVTLT